MSSHQAKNRAATAPKMAGTDIDTQRVHRKLRLVSENASVVCRYAGCRCRADIPWSVFLELTVTKYTLATQLVFMPFRTGILWLRPIVGLQYGGVEFHQTLLNKDGSASRL